MKKIIFISEIQDPEKSGGSTQIMSKNIIKGLYENNKELIFIAIVEDDVDRKNVIKNYSQITNQIIFITSNIKKSDKKNKYSLLFKLIKISTIVPNYRVDINTLEKDNKGILIITHSPSIESILIARQIKKQIGECCIHQYWSDPIAITGIYPEDLNIKRRLHYMLERKMLKYSDKIFYGTKILYKYQSQLYKIYKDKMSYIDVSYIEENKLSEKNKDKLLYGYTGNYYNEVRDIRPLYEMFINEKDKNLIICGNGNVQMDSKENIKVKSGRYSQNEILKIEEEIDVMIVLLNSKCIQIPGKVFYHMNTKKIILVIVDGKYGNEIKNELEKFNRYIFCENTVESIKKAIMEIEKKRYVEFNKNVEKFSPKNVYKGLL